MKEWQKVIQKEVTEHLTDEVYDKVPYIENYIRNAMKEIAKKAYTFGRNYQGGYRVDTLVEFEKWWDNEMNDGQV